MATAAAEELLVSNDVHHTTRLIRDRFGASALDNSPTCGLPVGFSLTCRRLRRIRTASSGGLSKLGTGASSHSPRSPGIFSGGFCEDRVAVEHVTGAGRHHCPDG